MPLNPLISKCQIKVCYVSDEPNRNQSIITKEAAIKIANSLPGSPIVGYFDEEAQDFTGHEKTLEIKDDKICVTEETKPYGFVDLHAQVWFQKFVDDGEQIREYLMTEGYLWTGQYPECKRVIKKGNNQSMEISDDPKFLDAHWTKDINGKPQFFIINEALISKLCILGEDREPCFEGAQISKIEFAFDDNFKNTYSQMVYQLQEIVDKGGFNRMTEQEKEKIDYEVDKTEQEDVVETQEVIETQQYNLEDIPEYTALKAQYSELEEKYNTTVSDYENMKQEMQELVEFKNSVEKQEKEDMIASFYVLSDEDKKDVREHIDEYSLDEIESKLAVICVRNKVNFNLDTEEEVTEEPFTYNLNDECIESVPGWVRAAQAVKKEKNL